MTLDAQELADRFGLSTARFSMIMEPPERFQSTQFDWTHEVQVALPASYNSSDTRYPVLWLTDGPTNFPIAVGMLNMLNVTGQLPEMIVVGVGTPPEDGLAEAVLRRNIEYTPPGSHALFDGPGGDFFRAAGFDLGLPQRADAHLDMLVDDLRPSLTARYRMADDHALYGHSGGGTLTAYALFRRPEAFGRWIIGSPSINAADRAVFALEAKHAASHQDLAGDVFLGAGEGEITQPGLSAWGIVSATALLAETLSLRNYPSLRLTARIFAGKDHGAVASEILSEGLRATFK